MGKWRRVRVWGCTGGEGSRDEGRDGVGGTDDELRRQPAGQAAAWGASARVRCAPLDVMSREVERKRRKQQTARGYGFPARSDGLRICELVITGEQCIVQHSRVLLLPPKY